MTDPALLLPISAPDPDALRTVADAYATFLDKAAFLDEEGAPGAADICYTAGAGRPHHRCRAAVTGTDGRSLAEALRALDTSGARSAEPGFGSVAPHVVFVFPGQSGQWVGMGRELLATNRVFARRIAECADVVESELGWSPIDRLHDDTPLTAVDEIQPMLWVIQVALAAVWQDLGIEPDLIIGHSLGEIAAATVSGGLTLADGGKLVSRRGNILRDAPPGAMWTVGLGEQQARQAIGTFADRVCVGVLNSQHSSVLSGDPDAVSSVVRPLLDSGVFCRRIKVGYASHSPQVDQMRPALLRTLAGLRPRSCTIPMHSTVCNAVVDGRDLGAGYWVDNLRSPVRFAEAIRSVLADGTPTLFVEISPHPTLITALDEAIAASGADARAVPSLRRKQSERATIAESLGAAYTAGCDPLWTRVYPGGTDVPLPELGG